MSERKVQNKYISKYFNHEKLVKIRKAEEKQHNVRMMLPFSIKCNTCLNYFKICTKINMRKETCQNESYLGIPIYRLYMKCITCYSEISMKTDPKNHDYTLEHGAVRLYESWKDNRASEGLLKEMRENDEEGNNMKLLEYKTYDSKKEMMALEKIEEIREISKRNGRMDIDEVIFGVKNKRVGEDKLERFREKIKEKDLEKFGVKEKEVEGVVERIGRKGKGRDNGKGKGFKKPRLRFKKIKKVK